MDLPLNAINKNPGFSQALSEEGHKFVPYNKNFMAQGNYYLLGTICPGNKR